MSFQNLRIAVSAVLVTATAVQLSAEPLNVSGVYPHLTMRNSENECGTGAVVPWAGSLWAITYAPHQPEGSSDKLYEISDGLEQRIFEGSVGGTPANRMIHRESEQLLIGPYLIDADKTIRTIPPSKMLGRLTGNARHLSDPENKVYYATMEEGLYEVDVNTLAVKCLIQDGHAKPGDEGLASQLPGYHGKGLYSGQGRLIYSNNGERGGAVRSDPTVTSGALAEWEGEGDWQLVRRNQFTEISGPGGIAGATKPGGDPVWAMGWDARSLILALLDDGEWHYYRLPKGSHSYDGAHGWNTEWPRIREIGEKDLLATMHGTFWRFPATLSQANSAGITPRSNYLKVIGDFCRWGDRVVLGCDDSAASEFLNTRSFKAKHGAANQSNSNLWFIEPARLDQLGPVIGRGSVWLRDDVEAGQASDPYLFSGYDHRQLHLTHRSAGEVVFALEVDREGSGKWEPLREFAVPSGDSISHIFGEDDRGAWLRLVSRSAAKGVTAHFQYRNRDTRGEDNHAMFAGIATPSKPAAAFGLMRSLAYDRLGLVAGASANGEGAIYYEINQKLEIVPVEKPNAAADLVSAVRQPLGGFKVDESSVLVVEDGKRYRLPKSDLYGAEAPTAKAGGGKTLEEFLDESLSRGATVRASSTHEGYDAKRAVDGSLTEDSRWVGNNEGEAWIEIDLGEKKSFRSVWVVSGWEGRASHAVRDFDLQIQNAGKWVTIPGGQVRGNAQVEREIVFAKPVAAQQLRLVSTDDGFVRLYEIAVFDRELEVAKEPVGFGPPRVCREVATERDLLNLHGTFYELPARNAQGMAKIRPVATHNLAVQDFCSHGGLLFITGIDADTDSSHIFRSDDRKAAVWAGVVDDLWKLGKPRGYGGPWKDTPVKADEPSDPYLMTAYDKKTVTVSSKKATTIRAEVDVDGTGLWVPWMGWNLSAGEEVTQTFPDGFSAYWIRFVSSKPTTATALLKYE